jgi:hypothetical protein
MDGETVSRLRLEEEGLLDLFECALNRYHV